jgi:hypothetical protein
MSNNLIDSVTTLNGHYLYVYGTFQMASSAAIAITTSYKPLQFTETIVNNGCALAGGPNYTFSMTKSGTYRLVITMTVSNAALTNQSLTTSLSVYGVAFIPGTTRIFNVAPGLTSCISSVTLPSYIANSQIDFLAKDNGAGGSLGIQGTVPADISIELIG